eukprot:COSAG03_NODE_9638_length_704_cov_0.887603_1_plen_54_part_01
MSSDLIWMLTRKQNCFIRQRKGHGNNALVRVWVVLGAGREGEACESDASTRAST